MKKELANDVPDNQESKELQQNDGSLYMKKQLTAILDLLESGYNPSAMISNLRAFAIDACAEIEAQAKQLTATQQALDAALIENSRYKKKKDDEQIVREGLWHNFTQMQVICNNKLEEISSLQKKLDSTVEALTRIANYTTSTPTGAVTKGQWMQATAKAALANIKE